MKFLFKQIKQKPVEYLVLGLIFILTFILYLIIRDTKIVFFTAILYFLWSLYHHYRRGDLQLSIIIEYLLIILLGLIVLFATL